jgi:hypothetical protein
MLNKILLITTWIVLILNFTSIASAVEIPDRRKDQVQTTPGYIATPAVANIPGLGLLYGGLASVFNIKETETDFMAYRFWGDLSGWGMGLIEMFILPWDKELLTINLFTNNFDKVGVEIFDRGPTSKYEDRKIIEIDSFVARIAQLNLRLLERRLHLFVSANEQTQRLNAIRDPEGELIASGDGSMESSFNRAAGLIIDLSDDRSDPRKGLQQEIFRYDRPDPGGDKAHSYMMEYNTSYYVPIGDFSTWGFNLYRSDAVVLREGETDRDVLAANMGVNCDEIPSGSQKDQCQEVVESFVNQSEASNRHGSAAGLGGTQRLRSYSTGRFNAAHTIFTGTEFRWNLTEEFTPFNILIAGGVRTGIQIAFFAEGGTVSELPEDLDKHWKYSYGTGIRAILASGFVVRLDIANGPEGVAPSMLFQYPWSVF